MAKFASCHISYYVTSTALTLGIAFSSDEVTSVAWHPSSRYLATAGGADKHIRVWHNAAGLKVQIDDLQGKLYRSKSDTIKVNCNERYWTCSN